VPATLADYGTQELTLRQGDWTDTASEISAWNDAAGNFTVSEAVSRPDIVGGRADLDGSAEHMTLGGGYAPTVSSGCTLIAKLDLRTDASTKYLLDVNGATARIIFCTETNGGLMGFFDGSFRSVAGATSITGDQFLAWSYGSTGEVFRGTTASNIASLGTVATGNVTTIGAVTAGVLGGPAYVSMLLDDVVLYQGQLSLASIKAAAALL
jgi:hypothetical protein